MSILYLLIVALVVVVYIQIAKRVSDKFTIIQTTSSTVLPDHILEKLPIIIYDRIVNPVQLLTTVFKYKFISIKQIPTKQTTVVKCAYQTLHAKNDTSVFIRHPNMDNIVDCKIEKHNVLLVPRAWTIKTSQPKDIDSYSCHTILSKFFIL